MNLVERVKNILLTPKTEWPVIDRESGDTAYLFTNYVAILAAIPAVCNFIGMMLLGAGRGGLVFALLSAIIGYLLAFVASYLMALIVNALAPSFGGRSDFSSALKLVVYSSTAAWIGGVFSLIPALAILGLVAALYGLYLLYLGIPVLMKSPSEKALVYTIVVIICAIIMWIVIAAIPGFLLLAVLGSALR